MESAAENLADKGRGSDELVGHLTPGDMVIPAEILNPNMMSMLNRFIMSNGGDPAQYIAGNKKNSLNPKTGMPEFGWLSNPLKGLEHSVSNLFSDPGKFLGNVLGNPLVETATAIADPALAPFTVGAESAGSGLLKGQGFLPSLEQGAEAGALAYGGEQLAGAAGNAFPETTSAINNAIPDLGITSTLQALGSDVGSGLSSGVNAAENAVGAGVGTADAGAAAGAGAGSSSGAALPTGIPSTDAALNPDQYSNFLDQNTYTPPATPTTPNGFQNITPGQLGSNVQNPSLFTQATNALGITSPTASAADQAANASTFANLNNSLPSGSTSNNAALTGGYFDTTAAGQAANAAPLSATATPTPSTGSQFLKNPGVGTFANMLEANPAAVVSAGGLGLEALKQGQLVKGQRQEQQIANQEQQQGQQLESYLQNGTLPPGVQQSITQAADARKAAIQSQYAAQGGSGSSAEQQDLAAVDAWSQGQGAQTAMSLLEQGIGETGLAAQLYGSIANTALQQDQALGQAVGNFASSLAGDSSGGGTTRKGTITFG